MPLAVVEERDRKKFEGGDNMRRRAQNSIASLHRLRAGIHPDAAAVVKGPEHVSVSLEIPRDDVGRVRLASTDEELIAFGAFLKRASGDNRSVTVVTSDMNLQIRAERAGLSVLWLPEKCSKNQPAKDGQ